MDLLGYLFVYCVWAILFAFLLEVPLQVSLTELTYLACLIIASYMISISFIDSSAAHFLLT